MLLNVRLWTCLEGGISRESGFLGRVLTTITEQSPVHGQAADKQRTVKSVNGMRSDLQR